MLSGDATATTIDVGNGGSFVVLSGNASVTTIDLGDASFNLVDLSANASATTILGGIGPDTVNLGGSGSVTTIDLGDGDDEVRVSTAVGWNPNIVITAGGGGGDKLELSGGSQTYDLQPTTLTGFDRLQLSNSNITALIDGDTLTGITSISGTASSKIVTSSASLDLSGKSVSGLTVQSSNATGTTFTVDSKTTGLQVLGGTGADTLHTTGFAFTALEREAIFGTSLIEVIIDASGFYGDETSNTIVGTAAGDVINGGAGHDRLTGGGGPDVLVGGSGSDTFVFNSASEGTDTIMDFVSGVSGDILQLSATMFGSAAGLPPATLIALGMVQYVTSTTGGTLFVDVDGAAGSVFSPTAIAQLPGVFTLQAGIDWFVL